MEIPGNLAAAEGFAATVFDVFPSGKKFRTGTIAGNINQVAAIVVVAVDYYQLEASFDRSATGNGQFDIDVISRIRICGARETGDLDGAAITAAGVTVVAVAVEWGGRFAVRRICVVGQPDNHAQEQADHGKQAGTGKFLHGRAGGFVCEKTRE